MINEDKWISSIGKQNTFYDEKSNQIDHDIWLKTIPKKKKYNVVRKYSLITVLFVSGLLLVSAIKNKTRSLEKQINNLKASNKEIKFNLNQAILDYEVITSPENLSILAKEYLDPDFVAYKKNQIASLNEDKIFNKDIKDIKKNDELTKKIKNKIKNKINKKKTELKKLQEIYSKPETIPSEIKNQVAKKIEKKKTDIKNLYSSPKETITLEKAQKWVAVQVVKVFLGIPVMPGK